MLQAAGTSASASGGASEGWHGSVRLAWERVRSWAALSAVDMFLWRSQASDPRPKQRVVP